MKVKTLYLIANEIIDCFKRDGILYICGNGGSHAMANHMEEEFICKFEHVRKPLPAISLKPHTSTSNDFGYEYVFSRQIQALCKPKDLVLLLSTSYKSKNIVMAAQACDNLGVKYLQFPTDASSTAEIQDKQQILMHDICRIVEKEFIS